MRLLCLSALLAWPIYERRSFLKEILGAYGRDDPNEKSSAIWPRDGLSLLIALIPLFVISLSPRDEIACTTTSCDDRILVVGKRISSPGWWVGPTGFEAPMLPPMVLEYEVIDPDDTGSPCFSVVGASVVLTRAQAIEWNMDRERAMNRRNSFGGTIGAAICAVARNTLLGAFCGPVGDFIGQTVFSNSEIPMVAEGCTVTPISTVCRTTAITGRVETSIRQGMEVSC